MAQRKQKNQTLYQIVLSETPFYAESGGQVGDTGVLVSEFETIDIIDTKKENNLPIHIAKKLPEHLEAPMMACVDTDKRAACAANHSCTHLLDEALRQVLGTHVEQKGSLVTPDSLRFDFSHFQKVTPEQIREVEHLVNAKIRENVPLTEYRNLPIEKAKELGAIALFGEKYGDEVRVVQFGSSIEFCGGTHVSATGKIGMVKIISESSVAAGVRRIEAVTGAKVEEMFDTVQDTINDLKALFNNAPDLKAAISKYIEENAGLKKQMEEFMKEKEAAVKNKLIEGAKEINGVKVIKAVLPMPADAVKNIAFQLKGQFTENLFVVIGSVFENKPGILAEVTDFITVNKGNIIYLDQYVDHVENIFFMRIEWELKDFLVPQEKIEDYFRTLYGQKYEMDFRLYFSDVKPRMAIFVSKMSHCLFDMLARYTAGEWNVEIPLIISNHPDLQHVAERFGIPFYLFPITKETKEEQERKEMELLAKHKITFIVLARYMQVISEQMINAYPNKIINIHHSFLPAFVGAKPYHAAFQRGVKIIGATSHYVTTELDAGPIIEQDVVRITHKDSIEDLVNKGKDLEKIVLSRAVQKHIERKILAYKNKTVIFS